MATLWSGRCGVSFVWALTIAGGVHQASAVTVGVGDAFSGIGTAPGTAVSTTSTFSQPLTDLFDDAPQGGFVDDFFVGTGPHTVNFNTAGAVTLSGVSIYTIANGGEEDGIRGANSFSFRADVDGGAAGDGVYEALLVNAQNPVDNGLASTYSFAPTTAHFFQFSITGSDGNGPRLLEVDAVVPEPAGLGLLGLAGIAAMKRTCRRRREMNH